MGVSALAAIAAALTVHPTIQKRDIDGGCSAKTVVWGVTVWKSGCKSRSIAPSQINLSLSARVTDREKDQLVAFVRDCHAGKKMTGVTTYHHSRALDVCEVAALSQRSFLACQSDQLLVYDRGGKRLSCRTKSEESTRH